MSHSRNQILRHSCIMCILYHAGILPAGPWCIEVQMTITRTVARHLLSRDS